MPLGRLDTGIITVRMQLNEPSKEEYDVEGVMDFAERLVLSAPRLWSQGSLEQKQTLQRLLFPGKITCLSDVFEPSATCLFYSDLEVMISDIIKCGVSDGI